MSQIGPDPALGLALAMQASPGTFALLLGSGISMSAGIPTGWDVVSELARRLAAAEGISPLPEDPLMWFAGRFASEADYSSLLQQIAPTAAQRRDLLSGYFEPTPDEIEQNLKAPTAAHHAIAQLVARGVVRVVVTTNFDRLLEQALAAAGVQPIVVASAASAAGTIPLAHSKCTLIKVHGDYLDPDIRNTSGELDAYDEAMDRLLDQVFDEYGLVVCGWSASWDVALRHALERASTRRYGTYWAIRGEPTPHAQRLIEARQSEVMTIDTADVFFSELGERIAALDTLRAPKVSLDVAVERAKQYLPDPLRRIRLHDLVMDATEVSVAEVTFDGNPNPSGDEVFLAQMKALERTSQEMMSVAAVLARFADRPDLTDLAVEAVQSASVPLRARLGGLTAWIHLRGYPLLLLTYSLGLGATAAGNWGLLGRVLSAPIIDNTLTGGERVPLGHLIRPGQIVMPGIVQKTFGENRTTPLSDYMHDLCQSVLAEHLRLPADAFADLFDQWEYLTGVVAHDGPGRGAVGRYVWRAGHSLDVTFPNQSLIAAAQPLLDAGLFRGDSERYSAVHLAYDEMVAGSGLRW